MKSFLNTFSKKNITISAPHNEATPPQASNTLEAKRGMRTIAPNPHHLSMSSVRVPKSNNNIVEANRPPFCSMDSLKFAGRHLAKMAELRDKCAPEHESTINKALTGIFLMTVASQSLESFREENGNRPWSELGLTDARTLSDLGDKIAAQSSALKKEFGVDLSHLSVYPQQASEEAWRYIRHLALSIAYDQGAKINPDRIKIEFNFEWSQHTADDALMQAFASTIRSKAHANWMSVLDILVHASKYLPPNNTQFTSSQTANSNPSAPPESSYTAALADARNLIAGITGKMPPDIGVVPKCGRTSSGLVYDAGNLTDFFNMAANEKTPEAQRQVEKQYKMIIKTIHPDKHGEKDYDALRAYVELTKMYTSAKDEARKWFES